MYPINLVINITKTPNPQVICFDACLALSCRDLSYQIQLSQEDKYLCQKGRPLLAGEALVWTGMMFGGPPNLKDGLLTPTHLAL
jgi:hypothetical protein